MIVDGAGGAQSMRVDRSNCTPQLHFCIDRIDRLWEQPGRFDWLGQLQGNTNTLASHGLRRPVLLILITCPRSCCRQTSQRGPDFSTKTLAGLLRRCRR